MTIDLKNNLAYSVALPVGPVRMFANSVLTLEVANAPATRNGKSVAAVEVAVTNADGVKNAANATKIGSSHFVRFAASCFAAYGEIENGVAVTLVYADESRETVAAGSLRIAAADASTKPGDPTKSLVAKGDEVFVKSRVVDGVQHFVKQVMSYDADMEAWGADWTGDYVLEDGDFVAVET
jgi:hypothetical protein